MTVTIGSLFSGYGGLDMAVADTLGGRVAWHCEFDPAPSKILAHHWPDTPNLGDITSVDWAAVEPVDVLTGGFPCQDLSTAGKRVGLRPGTRSGLWSHMAYAIAQLRPRLVVIENVRGILSAEAHSDLVRDCWCVGDEREPTLRALGAVLGDLAGLGYDARWGGVRASDAGAAHGRHRVFIVAHPHGEHDHRGWDARTLNLQTAGPTAAHPHGPGPQGPQSAGRRDVPTGGGGPAAVTLLPTPQAHDAQRPKTPQQIATMRAKGHGVRNLNEEAMTLLPTPKASDGPNGGPGMRNGRGKADALPGVVDFGEYTPAIARWAGVIDRPAPPPTEPGKSAPRLSPRFVEWLMGLPEGHVTDPAIGLSHPQQLKALGNGVVPQQAAMALRMLLGLPSEAIGTSEKAALLPTPAVNDMGAGKSPERWDEWTAKMQAAHGNGNGHGRSLAIESLRMGSIHPMTAWCCDWCGKRNAQAADTCQQCGRDITRPPVWRCHLCAHTTPAHQRACRHCHQAPRPVTPRLHVVGRR